MDNPANQPAVELIDVTKRYGDVVAVDNISLDIMFGEFFSLLGPSGCGKTTTLRMVAGFAHPTQGQVYIKGRLMNGVPAYERDTNLVFQQLALFPHMDVYDNIAFGPTVKRKLGKSEIKERVKRVLDLVELSGYENKLIQQLSGGQQQRIAIARALINEPTVLLLDEPLGALDLKLRLQMQVELKAIQQRVGTTFIYVTHDQGEAITMSDRIAVINKGHIEQVAPSEVIYSRPATKFVAQFIGDTNLLDGNIVSKDGDTLMIESQGLTIRAAGGGGNSLPTNSTVHMSIRPEKIKLLPRLPEAGKNNSPVTDNVFVGRIKNATFMGSIIRYNAILEGGTVLLVESPNETDNILHVGDEAQVAWARESCILLRGE